MELPIGTLVKLNNKLIMIIGYKYANPNKEYKVEDYIGVDYPIGFSLNNPNHIFNKDEIEEIVYFGYRKKTEKDFDEFEIKNRLNKYEFNEFGIVIKDNTIDK